MRLFKKPQPKDILFLIPVHTEGEKLPRNKIRMLYCDASGKVYTAMMNRSIYDTARAIADSLDKSQKSYAILGRETARGDYLPEAIEIDREEEQALDFVLEHALKSGEIPDILKKYIKSIIKRGQDIPSGGSSTPSPRH